jgi:hypothetical protein
LGAVALETGLNLALDVAARAAGLQGLRIDIPAELFVTKAPIRFVDSALARYLSAIIYRANGGNDAVNLAPQDITGIANAVTREAAAVAAIGNDQFGVQPKSNIYFNPASIADELNVPTGKGRLNIIAFAGRGPVKEEKIFDLDLRFFPNIVGFATEKNRLAKGNLALPILKSQPSQITGVEVAVAGGSPVKLDLLEDIEAGIQAAFAAKFKTTYLKTWLRSTIKYASVEISAQVGVQQGLPAIVMAGTAAGLKKAVDAGESADVRGSRYLPAKAYVGGINLDPGEYDITVHFNGGDTVTKHVKVEAGKLNLVEAVSLK